MGVLIRQFLRCESGAAVYEFTLIAALVSAAILASIIALGVKLDTAHDVLGEKAASPA
jgi:Flp pilus assembly pilin Flp